MDTPKATRDQEMRLVPTIKSICSHSRLTRCHLANGGTHTWISPAFDQFRSQIAQNPNAINPLTST
jgi:hypothetical protein